MESITGIKRELDIGAFIFPHDWLATELYVYVCMHNALYMCIYVHMYIHMYMYIHMCIYIYTFKML